MHKRDYLVKQFEEFGKVMGVLLGLKRDNKLNELSELISESLKKYTSLELEFLEALHDDSVISILTEEKNLNDEQLKMLADLLFEKAEHYSMSGNGTAAINCYRKANTIYLFLKEHATLNYSLDMHYKLEVIKKMDL